MFMAVPSAVVRESWRVSCAVVQPTTASAGEHDGRDAHDVRRDPRIVDRSVRDHNPAAHMIDYVRGWRRPASLG